MQKSKFLQKMIRPIEDCIYAIKAKMSDLLQVLRLADILGVPQAIKGFDKLYFCYVLSQQITANAHQ